MSSLESYECTACGHHRVLVNPRGGIGVPKVLPCLKCRHAGETSKHTGSIELDTGATTTRSA